MVVHTMVQSCLNNTAEAQVPDPNTVVVVGAGLAGAGTCEQLRRLGYGGRIVLIGQEDRAPYDRPPLTKAVLRGALDDTTLRIDLLELDVEFLRGAVATSLSLADHTVETSTGSVAFDSLVIATGTRPVTLPGDGPQHTVRSIEDALALRVLLRPGARVVIVGASWIGAEVATTALAMGCTVTCLEAAPTVAHAALGDLGRRLEPWWHEVNLRLEAQVAWIGADGVRLTTGEIVPADIVVTGVGARANVEWLDGSGLVLDRGVVVDERLRAADGVVAVGDVATWWSERFQRRLRVEHWDHAVASAETAAASVLGHSGDESRYDPVPYFWSDQFGHKIQYVGAHESHSSAVVRSGSVGDKWSAGWLEPDGRLVGFIAVDSPRELLAARELLTAGAVIDRERFADAKVPLRETVLEGAASDAAAPR